MKKSLLLSIFAFVFAISGIAKAEMSLGGYTEFAYGTADQKTLSGQEQHGVDKGGLSNGTYSRITANYSSTLDSGIEMNGTFGMTARDCQGDKSGNCNVVNHNFATFSGGFGSISIGERFDAGALMLSRMTASGPTAEPDGALYTAFYTADTANNYGSANEINYANNAMKILYSSNTYSGFSFAASYTPNSRASGTGVVTGQPVAATTDFSDWGSFNDILATYAKYSMEMDGVGVDLVYGIQTGNAGRIGANEYNDLDETSYSVKLSYAGFSADYRKNEAGNSGFVKNGNAGNDEGTSVCAEYGFGSMRVNACQVETSFTDASNRSNSQDTMTYAADYSLGGGATLGLLYFDVEQVANGVTMTDADGLMSILSIGF